MSVVLTYSKELLKIESNNLRNRLNLYHSEMNQYFMKKEMHMTLNHRKMPTFAPNKKNANYPFLNYPISKSSKL